MIATRRPLTHTEREALLAECFTTGCGWPSLSAEQTPAWTRGRWCAMCMNSILSESEVRPEARGR